MSWLDRILFRGKKRPGQWRPVQESKGDVAVGDGAVLDVSSNSYRSLIGAAVSDAERIAADIREKARKEANAEAARVLAQANLEAEQLKAKAEVIAREEAVNIISEAEQTAAGIEIEAKKRAVQFLVKQSQLIEKEIAREYRLALAKLSASLQSLSSDSDKINLQLKRRMAMLAANKSLALNEAKTALLGTTAETTPEKANDESMNRGQGSGKKGRKQSRKRLPPPVEIQPEPVLPPTSTNFKLEKAVPAAVAEPAGIVVKEPASVAAMPEPVKQKPSDPPSANGQDAPGKLTKFFSFSFSLTGKKEKPPAVAVKKEAKPAVINKGQASSAVTTTPEQVEAPPASAETPFAEVSVKATPEDSEAPATGVSPAPGAAVQAETALPTLLDVDTQTQYSGEVELMIVPPVDLKLVTQLYNYLQTLPELKVLYTRGSWDQGTTIVVVLEKPFALVQKIIAIPNINVSIGILEKDAAAGGKTMSLLRRKDRPAKRLGLILKEAVAAPKA